MSYETRSATKIFKVTPAESDIPGGTVRGLILASAGTVNLTFEDGSAEDGVPLVQGWNPVYVDRVRPGGTAAASGIWAYR